MYYTLDVNQIPEQFHLCDGTRIDDLDLSNRYFDEDKEKAIDRIKSYLKELFGDNLPNLMNKFIYGASDDHEPFSTGGSKEVTLTKENLPEHSHYYSGSYIWENSREPPAFSSPAVESIGGILREGALLYVVSIYHLALPIFIQLCRLPFNLCS